MEPGLILTGVITMSGILIWAVRQEGRLNAHDREHEEHRKRDDQQKTDVATFRTEVREDLNYIRERIDEALNKR